MSRLRGTKPKPQVYTDAEVEAFFRQWYTEQKGVRRAGKRNFSITMNSQGDTTTVEGQSPPKRYG